MDTLIMIVDIDVFILEYTNKTYYSCLSLARMSGQNKEGTLRKYPVRPINRPRPYSAFSLHRLCCSLLQSFRPSKLMTKTKNLNRIVRHVSMFHQQMMLYVSF